jgi:hypothetical protein
MEQIYYTQCPLGYGLGASNGYQIKRHSANYPLNSDVRHLGLKAFLPGTRTLAPKTLRYRRQGDVLEVAWLAPRLQEYVTERGAWGRPGGLFAHGLRLSVDELAAIGHWPAGLYGSQIWREEDREPTRGQLLPPIALTSADLARAPRFAEVAPLAADLETGWLAQLLTAIALAARQGRTLFLIDEAERLADRIQLLTFAFPEPLRDDLTFSTHHDRPEELGGFRIQGVARAARPNRPALTALGFVADLAATQLEPNVRPEAWADTLAAWLTGRDDGAFQSWERLIADHAEAIGGASYFQEGWLDRLVHFWRETREPVPRPLDTRNWHLLADLGTWVGPAGLAPRWLRARPASWWIEAARALAGRPEAAQAFLAQASALGGAGSESISGWGQALALWLAGEPAESLLAHLSPFWDALPASAATRLPLIAGLTNSLEVVAAERLIDRLKQQGMFDPSLLLPLEARGAVAALADRHQAEPLTSVFRKMLSGESRAAEVLDAVEVALGDRAPADREAAAACLATALSHPEARGHRKVWAWALRRGQEAAVSWLGPYLRRLFLHPDGRSAWEVLRQPIRDDLSAGRARVALSIAAEDDLPDDAFRWGVECLLLPLPAGARPEDEDPTWPDTFLARTSFVELVNRLFLKPTVNRPLQEWISSAIDAGRLSSASLSVLKQARKYATGLRAKDAPSLLKDLPAVLDRDREAIFDQVLSVAGNATVEAFEPCLGSFRELWPGAFDPGASHLAGLSRPLGRALLPWRGDEELWLHHLEQAITALGLRSNDQGGFEPDSYAAFVVATTMRLAGDGPDSSSFDPWRLRAHLLNDDASWQALAVDARLDLHGEDLSPDMLREHGRALSDDPAADPSTRIYRAWFRRLDGIGAFRRNVIASRFREVLLNCVDARRLTRLACGLAAELNGWDRGRVRWWDARPEAGIPSDIRERFARTVPLAPLPREALPSLREWMGRPYGASSGPLSPAGDPGGLVPLDGEPVDRSHDVSFLSPSGQARWSCLHALSIFHNPDIAIDQRWKTLLSNLPPLDGLADPSERYLFFAWLMHLTDDFLVLTFSPERLATALLSRGLDDEERLMSWSERELPGVVGPLDVLRPGLADFLSELRRELRIRKQQGRGRWPVSTPG